MMLECDYQAQAEVELTLAEDELAKIAELVLREEGVSRDCHLSVSAVSDEQMRALNLKWRGLDAATDVLSLECERPDDDGLADGEPCELGDIVFAPAYIEHQAAQFGTTPADETRILFVHGLLHLLGYDHNEDEEAELMESREDNLLAQLDCDGDLGRVVFVRHKEEAS